MRRDALGHRRIGGLALIDRRQAAPEQHLAAEVELLGRFVAGIDPPRRLEPLELALVEGEALRLADGGVGREAEPGQVGVDRLDERLARALGVGIVDPQQEAPAIGACANSALWSAVRMLPTWSRPVGDGAKRVVMIGRGVMRPPLPPHRARLR